MNTTARINYHSAAQALIHTEHSETQLVIDAARKGGILGWIATFMSIAAGFLLVHTTGLIDSISVPLYLVWLVAGIALSFAGAITGMLIGVLWGKAQSQVNIWYNHESAINDALEEINTRRRIRKVVSS